MSVLNNIKTLSLLLVASVGTVACASVLETPNQEIEIVTPGVLNSRCDVLIGTLKYPVEPPQKLTVKKSEHPITVDCIAPGDRREVVTYDPKVSKYTAGNVATAGIGAGYDYLSGAMFQYPEKIIVSFGGIYGGNPHLPGHYASDLEILDPRHHPEYLGIEALETKTSFDRRARSGWVSERERRKGAVDTGYKTNGDVNHNVSHGDSDGDIPSIVSPYFPQSSFDGSTSF